MADILSILMSKWCGKGMADGGLPFLSPGCPVPNVGWPYLLCMKWLMYRILLLQLSSSLGYFCQRTSFSNNSMEKLLWPSFISNLNTKLRIISIVVQVWKNVPLLYGDPLWGACFKCQLVCKFGIVERNFLVDFLPLFTSSYITYILPVIFPLKWFYCEETFYIKWVVMSYSVDIVSTVSYNVLCSWHNIMH